jgi:uncharacterized protein (TIGR03084 family)
VTTPDVIADLQAEYAAADKLLSALSPDQWSLATPAPGWDVASQVVHLGMFDRRAMWSMVDPDRFIADRDALMARGTITAIEQAEHQRAPHDLLQWWRDGSADIVRAAHNTDLSAKCQWYGPPMAAMSMLTARLMETWAHVHDIADAVGISVEPTNRLKHVAHIGVRARPFAYAVNKREMPTDGVYVALRGPEGDVWTWGDESSLNRITGDALGFCQVVTQRRHVNDGGLTIEGDAAREWMSIAQAFAGPPGEGRTPGQFS